ncbi:MAG: hypothetical protein FJW96_06410 [Actinobacteria bacterium]|nr:hypothetical protein [Actinomycetota bacterium]
MVDGLLLRRFRDGSEAPFDARRVREAFARLAVEIDGDGLAELYAGDGGEGTIGLAGLRDPGGLTTAVVDVARFTHGLAGLVHAIATAADLTVSLAGGHRVYLTDGGQVLHLPPPLAPAAHTCVDGPELHWWLTREATTPDGRPTPQPTRQQAVSRSDALRSLFGLRRGD